MTNKRWNQTNEKTLKSWKRIFKDKFKEFQDDVWTLTTITTNLPLSDEWEFSLEERVGMALKCKACNHVWVTDHGLVCFYYNKPIGEVEGKVLVWLKPATCPLNKDNICSSSVPMIDVYRDEIETVLCFLMMQVGWSFYQRQYSKNDEDAIEKRRVLREKKAKKKNKNKKKVGRNGISSTGNSVKSIVAETNIAAPLIEPTASLTTQSNVSSVAPVQSGAVPSQPAQAIKRVTKLRTRWDKSRDEIVKEWEIIFEGKFSDFTLKCPSDKWVMRIDKVIKSHPLRREKKWERFLGERCVAGFKCEKCGYVWESKKGWISFWIWQNPPNNEGERIGEVVVHILGQKCANCPGNSNDKPYSTGDLQGEHIDAVLSALFMEIDYWFYGNESYTDLDEKIIDDKLKGSKPPYYNGRGVHRRESCQACREKVCTRTVTACYPNSVFPPNP